MSKEKRELRKYLNENMGLSKKKTNIWHILLFPFIFIGNLFSNKKNKKIISDLDDSEYIKLSKDVILSEDVELSEDVCPKTSSRGLFKNLLYDNLDDYIDDNKNNELTFQKLLFRFIDRTDMIDSDVYTAGGIDRRLFSKIRTNENYHPSKETVIQLGIGLKLDIDDLSSLLASASYTLSKNNYFDLIIRWCFEHKIYNLIKINEFLYDYNCKLLGRD